MTKQPQTRTDITGLKKHTMESLFVDDVSNELIASTFYLPIDVRKNPDFIVEKPIILSNEEFISFNANYEGKISYDGELILLINARQVAISHRYSRRDGNWYCVAKVWYGEKVA